MDRLLLTVFLCVSLVPLVFSAGWDYVVGGKYGPGNWTGTCKDGSSQSPIDIKMAGTSYMMMSPFNLKNYDKKPEDNYTLLNNGHTLQVNFPADYFKVSGGGLTGEFETVQFHLHWGSDKDQGSEHTMEGKAYPAEIHFVSYNKKYPNISAALPHSDGLAVLGVFIEEVEDDDNPAYDFLKYAPNVITASSMTIMPFTLRSMLPGMLDKFFRYSGSLTTPTCNEIVTWTVFKDTVKISAKQMDYLRNLEFTDGSEMVNNYRPVQKLNNRKVYNSFDKPASTVAPTQVAPASTVAPTQVAPASTVAPTEVAGAGILDVSIGLFSLMLLTALFGR